MTNHTWTAEMILDRLMADPAGPETLRLTREGIRDGRWGDDHTDAIGQGPYSSWPMEQLAMFAIVHNMIYGGEVATVRIGTTGQPQPDKMRAENARTLSRLPRPFTALVDMGQHNSEGGGILRWDEPITVSLCTGLIDRGPDGSTRPLSVSYEIPPGSAVLEIGQSLASRTWAHLAMDSGKVARWAYGHSLIYLLVNLDFVAAKDRMWAEFDRKYRQRGAVA
jgi:hypothetical protein